MQGDYKTEFGPEYALPRPLLDALGRAGWQDSSWGNDVSPSFTRGDLRVWCDAKVPTRRECGGPRYHVSRYDADDNWLETVFECVATAELIAWLQQHKEQS